MPSGPPAAFRAQDASSHPPSPPPTTTCDDAPARRDSETQAKLERQLLRDVGRAIAAFDLINEGDRIMVAMSGGKDSYTLLSLLQVLARRAPVRFELVAVHLDQGHPGYDGAPLRAFMASSGVEHHVLREDTYSIVTDKIPEGKTYCSLCSRLRRGILYRAADDLRCNKIALGHHRDDALETLLLNLFFGGKLAAMPARLTSDDGAHVVIRPLIYAAEETIAAYAQERAYPILPCNLCGSQSEAQRKQMKALLDRMEAEHPRLRNTMLAALGNVVPSHLLDTKLPGAAGAAAGTEVAAVATEQSLPSIDVAASRLRSV